MKNLALSAIVITTLMLAASYATAGQWAYAFIIVGLGIGWLISEWCAWQGLTSAGFVAFVGAAAWGINLDLSTIWMLLSAGAALVAWDLTRFSRRIAYAESTAEQSALQQAHLQRVFGVGGLGILLGGLAIGLQIKLNFGWAVLLGLVMIVSLSWVVGRIRRNIE